MNWKERERAFFIYAPLAIVSALLWLPAFTMLVVAPRVPHALLIAALVMPLLTAAAAFGIGKLALGAVEKPFTILNVLNFSAIIVLLVILGYTGLFLAFLVANA